MKHNTTYTDLRVAFSFLDNRSDRKPTLYDLSWQAVINILSTSEERKEKDGPAFVPAEFGEFEYKGRDGGEYKAVLRKKKAVLSVSMAVLDYEGGATPSQVRKHFEDFEFLMHTTHSHTKAKPKFRVGLPLAKPIAAEKWESVWLHLRDLSNIDGNSIDIACSDASRLYYLPSHVPGNKHAFYYNAGKLLELPKREHHEVLSRRMEAAFKLSAAPMEKARNKGKEVTLEQWLNDNRVYYQPKPGDSSVFQLDRCPWSAEHESGTDGLGHSCVHTMSDGRWAFSCCHATCKTNSRGWKDFREAVAGPKKEFKKDGEFKLTFGRRK